MSQSVRQSELFAGADWQVIYRAFTEINFNASDPPSINRALRQYIQTNYAEDYTDWIESSEFVAIIDLLSWLAGTLAFKTDINARENFLESAEARESILRLARFLSYNARRNQAARGLLKIVEVETNDDVYDSFGNNLANRTIAWNDTDDADWFERFVLILNNAMVSTNPFGIPLRSGSISGIRTQLYRLNARFGDIAPGFSAVVNGTSMDFEIVNGDFAEDTGFFERSPNFDAAFHMFYRADGNGNGSAATGFFTAFKQGILRRNDYLVSDPIENRTIDIDVENINQTDVWVQTVDDAGSLLADWQKVPAIFSDNVTFNSIDAAIRNIFSVTTRDRDQITLRFSDGRFGAVPVGNLRAWYRVSNGLQYQIRPQEISNIRITLPFYNRRGVRKNITLTLSLQETVSNSAPRETDEEIRFRAPSVYATQNRMVSGEDYNTFPLQSNLAIKIKSVNRVYSGHSRFIDLNDPTGTYQSTSVFADDGMFYQERQDVYAETPVLDNRTPEEIIDLYIQPALLSQEASNYVQDRLMGKVRSGVITAPQGMLWMEATDARFTGTGYFTVGSELLAPGATLQFEKNGVRKWVSILDITRAAPDTYAEASVRMPVSGNLGPVTLAEPVDTGSRVVAILPAFLPSLPDSTRAVVLSRIGNSQSFTLWYNFKTSVWTVRAAELTTDPDEAGSDLRMMLVDYVSGIMWRFRTPGMRYVFESERKVHWYFDGQRVIDQNTGLQQQDIIRILQVNEDVTTSTGRGLGRVFDLSIDKMVYYPDGYADPHRVSIRFRDRDEDGVADDPDTFYRLISANPKDSHLFWERTSDGLFEPTYTMLVCETEAVRLDNENRSVGTVAYQINGTLPQSFWIMTSTGWQHASPGRFKAARGRGPNVAAEWIAANGAVTTAPRSLPIAFHWKHFTSTDRRIDPAITNVIDTFVLTREYDFNVRQWIANGADTTAIPVPPTELDLRMAFNEFEQYKMFSDQIVWRPVRYKFLFGPSAIPELRAQFKVVKLPNSAMSDGEIKSRIIRAIDEYFSASFWDFGETFYFTELAAYLHQKLASVIASVVIVPTSDGSTFGDGFEVRSRSDELFISTARVQDVIIINSNTPDNLRML